MLKGGSAGEFEERQKAVLQEDYACPVQPWGSRPTRECHVGKGSREFWCDKGNVNSPQQQACLRQMPPHPSVRQEQQKGVYHMLQANLVMNVLNRQPSLQSR